jgi:hypothetical protein
MAVDPTEYAKPGDVIEVTWDEPEWKGKRLTVIKPPDWSPDYPGAAWHENEQGPPSYFSGPSYYKVVERAGRSVPTEGRDTDAFLRKQRDENLRRVFRS